MNLRDCAVHADNGDHFLVSHGGGKPFRVAKAGIEKHTLAKISELHQQGLDEGGDVAGDTTLGQALFGSNPDKDERIAQSAARAQQALADKASSEKEAAEEADQKKALASSLFGLPRDQPAAIEPVAAQTQPSATTPQPAAPGVGGGDLEAQIIAGGRQYSQAQMDGAKAIAKRAGEDQTAYEAQVKAFQDSSAQRQKDKAENQQKIDGIANEVANGKVDPSHFWSSRTTGQKIGSAIALILGGIGGGLTGRPNAALDVLNRAEDLDIESQKASLEHKKSMLGYYVSKGHSIDEAAALTKLDLKDISAATIQAHAAKYAGPEAAQAAAQNSANMRIENAKARAAIRDQAATADIKKMELLEKQYEFGMRQNTLPFTIAARSGASVPNVPAAHLALPPDQTITSPDGRSVVMANSKEDADKIKTARQAAADYENSLQELTGLSSQNAVMPYGSTSRSGEAALQRFTAASKALQDASGLGKSQEEAQMEKSMGNVTDIMRTQGGTQKLIDAARKQKNRHLNTVHANHLVGGQALVDEWNAAGKKT